MKITEPKTPYADHYDPVEDEAELARLDAEAGIDANGLVVDEVDALKKKKRGRSDSDIPGLDLGEAEVDSAELDALAHEEGLRRVIVEPRSESADGQEDERHHGEVDTENLTESEREKHKKFEQMRKKHYEIRNIKDILA
jgi:protein phosphatase inhibitor 2